MYPPILVFRPDLAKAMLGYRIQGIGEAQQRAAEGGYQGARYNIKTLVNLLELLYIVIVIFSRFPWESAYTGAEVTPDLCVACRENQQHITGDIAWAARSLVGKEWRSVRFQPENTKLEFQPSQEILIGWHLMETTSSRRWLPFGRVDPPLESSLEPGTSMVI